MENSQNIKDLHYNSVKQACSIGDIIFKEIIGNFKNFKTENDVKKFAYQQMKKHNVNKAFPIIIATGKNGFEIHHIPNNTKLTKGFCVIDMGVRVNKYCSDMTRTIYLGTPSEEEKQLYNLLLNSVIKSEEKARPNISYSELDKFSRELLGDYKKHFTHALGHGVGKRIHQNPRVSPKSKHTAKEGDIITIEPGIYLENRFGIRIEDTGVIRKDSYEILTKTTKDLIILEEPSLE